MIQKENDYPNPKTISLEKFLKQPQDAKRLLAEDPTNAGWTMLGEVHMRPHYKFAIDPKKVAHAQLLAAQSSDNRTKGHPDHTDIGLIDCPECGGSFPESQMNIDHQIPQADEGRLDNTNQLLLCIPCNIIKCELLTISGLRRYNRLMGRMRSEIIAETRWHMFAACATKS